MSDNLGETMWNIAERFEALATASRIYHQARNVRVASQSDYLQKYAQAIILKAAKQIAKLAASSREDFEKYALVGLGTRFARIMLLVSCGYNPFAITPNQRKLIVNSNPITTIKFILNTAVSRTDEDTGAEKLFGKSSELNLNQQKARLLATLKKLETNCEKSLASLGAIFYKSSLTHIEGFDPVEYASRKIMEILTGADNPARTNLEQSAPAAMALFRSHLKKDRTYLGRLYRYLNEGQGASLTGEQKLAYLVTKSRFLAHNLVDFIKDEIKTAKSSYRQERQVALDDDTLVMQSVLISEEELQAFSDLIDDKDLLEVTRDERAAVLGQEMADLELALATATGREKEDLEKEKLGRIIRAMYSRDCPANLINWAYENLMRLYPPSQLGGREQLEANRKQLEAIKSAIFDLRISRGSLKTEEVLQLDPDRAQTYFDTSLTNAGTSTNAFSLRLVDEALTEIKRGSASLSPEQRKAYNKLVEELNKAEEAFKSDPSAKNFTAVSKARDAILKGGFVNADDYIEVLAKRYAGRAKKTRRVPIEQARLESATRHYSSEARKIVEETLADKTSAKDPYVATLTALGVDVGTFDSSYAGLSTKALKDAKFIKLATKAYAEILIEKAKKAEKTRIEGAKAAEKARTSQPTAITPLNEVSGLTTEQKVLVEYARGQALAMMENGGFEEARAKITSIEGMPDIPRDAKNKILGELNKVYAEKVQAALVTSRDKALEAKEKAVDALIKTLTDNFAKVIAHAKKKKTVQPTSLDATKTFLSAAFGSEPNPAQVAKYFDYLTEAYEAQGTVEAALNAILAKKVEQLEKSKSRLESGEADSPSSWVNVPDEAYRSAVEKAKALVRKSLGKELTLTSEATDRERKAGLTQVQLALTKAQLLRNRLTRVLSSAARGGKVVGVGGISSEGGEIGRILRGQKLFRQSPSGIGKLGEVLTDPETESVFPSLSKIAGPSEKKLISALLKAMSKPGREILLTKEGNLLPVNGGLSALTDQETLEFIIEGFFNFLSKKFARHDDTGFIISVQPPISDLGQIWGNEAVSVMVKGAEQQRYVVKNIDGVGEAFTKAYNQALVAIKDLSDKAKGAHFNQVLASRYDALLAKEARKYGLTLDEVHEIVDNTVDKEKTGFGVQGLLADLVTASVAKGISDYVGEDPAKEALANDLEEAFDLVNDEESGTLAQEALRSNSLPYDISRATEITEVDLFDF